MGFDGVALVVVFWCLGLSSLFWIIRLGVRYGVNDAPTMNRPPVDTNELPPAPAPNSPESS